MKKFTLLVAFITLTFVVKAQDIIVLRNTHEVQAKVESVGQNEIIYRKWTNLEGPTYTLAKGDIFFIKYANGEKDIIQQPQQGSLVLKKQMVAHLPKENKEAGKTIRYRGEVNFGYVIAPSKVNIFIIEQNTSQQTTNSQTDNYYCGATDTLYSNLSRPLIETIHGCELSKNIFVGAGVGLQYYYGNLIDIRKFVYMTNGKKNWNALSLPIFANFKLMMPIKDKLTPYLNLSLGGSVICYSSLNTSSSESGADSSNSTYIERLDFSQKLHGGFYCDLGAGIQYGRINLSLGMQYQMLRINYLYDYKKAHYYYGETRERVYHKTKFDLKTPSFYVKLGVNF